MVPYIYILCARQDEEIPPRSGCFIRHKNTRYLTDNSQIRFSEQLWMLLEIKHFPSPKLQSSSQLSQDKEWGIRVPCSRNSRSCFWSRNQRHPNCSEIGMCSRAEGRKRSPQKMWHRRCVWKDMQKFFISGRCHKSFSISLSLAGNTCNQFISHRPENNMP